MDSSTRAQWFPATVLIPGGQTFRRIYVIACEGGANHGLHVYTRPDVRAWHAPVDWSRTVIPDDRTARLAGVSFYVFGAGGLVESQPVVVTPGGGCLCGPLGRWKGPDFAGTVSVR